MGNSDKSKKGTVFSISLASESMESTVIEGFQGWSLHSSLKGLWCFESTSVLQCGKRNPRGRWSTWHLPLSSRAKQISSSTTKHKHLVWEIKWVELPRVKMKNTSSAPPPHPPPPQLLQEYIGKAASTISHSSKALPSAMRCSGTCKITRTERLQERWDE